MENKIIMEKFLVGYRGKLDIPKEYSLGVIESIEDEKQWENLISEVFNFQCDIDKNLKNEGVYSRDRVFILKYKGKVIATATAWYRPEYGEKTGYLHMVAVDSKFRGRGLSKIVVIAAMLYMVSKGEKRVVLKTDSFRTEAIGLYKKLGFTIIK